MREFNFELTAWTMIGGLVGWLAGKIGERIYYKRVRSGINESQKRLALQLRKMGHHYEPRRI